ncbi:MAG: DUF2806 domain-containing protein [Prevotella sp.]|nr:DUF2806 domain-containing protein [Prevotella sp.]
MLDNFSLFDLSGNEGVSKLSETLAGVIEPLRAIAEIKARQIRAEGDEKILNLVERYKDDPVLSYVYKREVNRLMNLASVAQEAVQQLETETNISDEPVSNDWITFFSDIAEKVSSSELQHILGKILAGEVVSPGKYSIRFVNLIVSLNKQQADYLIKLKRLLFDRRYILIDLKIIRQAYATLYTCLVGIGIIDDVRCDIELKDSYLTAPVIVGNRRLYFTTTKPLSLSIVGLTDDGLKLMELIEDDGVDEEFQNEVIQYFAKEGVKISTSAKDI